MTIFLFITALVDAHLMAKAGLHLRVEAASRLPEGELLDEKGPVEGEGKGASPAR